MNTDRIKLCFLVIPAIITSCTGNVGSGSHKAGQTDYRLSRLHYENTIREKAVTHFYYNREGGNYLAVWHLEDSTRSSLNKHTLDSAGNLLLKERQFSDGMTSVQHFRYNGEGDLLYEDFQRSDSVYGEVDYIYDSEGRLQYADCRGLNGWLYGKIAYVYEEGIKTHALILKDSLQVGTINYDYQDDILIREHWDFNGEWSQTFSYEYQVSSPRTYTSSNVFIEESPWFRISSEQYDFSSESGGPSYYSYDENGKLITKEFVRSDGLSTITSYDYDSMGLLDHSLREYHDGRKGGFLYWFSIDRKLLVKTFSISDGNSGSETYRYKDGRLMEGEYVNMDGWLNGNLFFKYGNEGLLESGRFEGKDGFDADISYLYDKNYMLSEVHWIFSTGHSQTYRFGYQAAGNFPD